MTECPACLVIRYYLFFHKQWFMHWFTNGYNHSFCHIHWPSGMQWWIVCGPWINKDNRHWDVLPPVTVGDPWHGLVNTVQGSPPWGTFQKVRVWLLKNVKLSLSTVNEKRKRF
jgi:hypothetical protein